MSKKCNYCDAYIDFIKTPAGKWMCVESESVDPKTLDENAQVFSPSGEMFLAKELLNRAGVYVAHWANCPGSDRARKPRDSQRSMQFGDRD